MDAALAAEGNAKRLNRKIPSQGRFSTNPGQCENSGEMRRVLAMALLGFGIMAAAGCKSLPPPTPLAELNPQQARGHATYQARCAQCHYDRRDAPLRGPSLLGVFQRPSLPSGAPANDERVTATILHGRNMMPAMANSMSEADVQDVLAYLHTL
jgi:mono/diheme cytochrome c family protein